MVAPAPAMRCLDLLIEARARILNWHAEPPRPAIETVAAIDAYLKGKRERLTARDRFTRVALAWLAKARDPKDYGKDPEHLQRWREMVAAADEVAALEEATANPPAAETPGSNKEV